MPLEYWVPAFAGTTSGREDREVFDLAELERAHEIVRQAVPATPPVGNSTPRLEPGSA